MNRRYFSSPKTVSVLSTTYITLVVLLEMSVIFFVKNDGKLFLGIGGFLLLLIRFFIDFKKYRNAFVLFQVDEQGLHTKYLDLDWTAFSSYVLLETEVYRSGQYKNPLFRVDSPSVVCLGECKKDKPFIAQNKRTCIFFSLTQKHLQLIETYGKTKSEFVEQFLNDYQKYAE